MKRAVLFFGLVASMAATVSADPLVPAAALSATARQSLASQVRVDRARRPAAYQRVATLHGLDPRTYRASRAGRPTVSRELRAMGPDALLPMLDVLAVSGFPRALSDDERAALELGVLEAVGELRDRRAAPALRAAFDHARSDDTRNAAARALGRLGGDDELAMLRRELTGAHAHAAIVGLGACERPEALQSLLDALSTSRDDDTTAAAATALSSHGSTWAQASRGARDTTSSRVADALVRAFVRSRGDARDAVQIAILATGAPDTVRIIDAARATADADTQRALDRLRAIAARQ